MADAYMQYIHEDTGTVARWHGGEYIDLGYIQNQGVPGIDGDEFHAVDVINVWDHANNCPRIGFHLDEFSKCVDDHINGVDDDEEDEDEDESDEPESREDFAKSLGQTCDNPADPTYTEGDDE